MKDKKQVSNGKINKFNILFVDLQIVFTILNLILLVVFLFGGKVRDLLQLSIGATLLVMAYNNQVIYKRKNMTVFYVAAGGALLIIEFISLIGGQYGRSYLFK